MGFLDKINQDLSQWFLLKHPYYQAWNNGELPLESLGLYAREYFHHVAAFPRYISQIHALCPRLEDRQVLLENLIEEEQGEENHPELWLRFVEGISGSRAINESGPELSLTKELVDGFFELTRQDYETGLGALYAYERQTPEVAESKINGLKTHYEIHDAKTLQFFDVHQKADEWHTEELCRLINRLSPESQKKVRQGALKGAELLWGFLDGVYAEYENHAT